VRARLLASLCVGAVLAVAACGSSSSRSATSDDPTIDDSAGADRDDDAPVRCVVRLHGKGGAGDATTTDVQGIREVMPTGNEDGWGGRQWIYFPSDRYEEARDVVSSSIVSEGCDVAVINGFSNGASFAAAMLCAGETFGDVVRGYVIDDPVTDGATAGCAPPPGIQRVLYWTSAVDQPAGTACSDIDWTCAGGVIVDVQTFADDLGTDVVRSPNTEHIWYREAPEVDAFLGT
jgi:hypothetical protein